MNKICTVCGRSLVLKPGGVKKDGTTYKPFMGCEVWDDEHKRARDAYKAATTSKTSTEVKNKPKDVYETIGDSLGRIELAINQCLKILKENTGE